MRYIITTQQAIFADSDEEAQVKANNLNECIRLLGDNHNDSDIIEIHAMPFGAMKGRKL